MALEAAATPPSAPAATPSDADASVGLTLSRDLATVDPAIARIIQREERRQRLGIELIASENYASAAVREATGSVLTNKYAEGLPGRRYYGGCEHIDEAEELARDRVKALFGAEHANVQPHSGSSANMAAYRALLKPGDRILAMRLDQGGHLTHGSPVNFSGADYEVVAYGVDPETELINYDELAAQAREHRPKMILGGATAYPRAIDFNRMAEIAEEVGAALLVDMAHIAGLVAVGLHPDPVPVSDIVTSTTHKTLRGPRGGIILGKERHAKAIDKKVFPHLQGGPLEHVVAAKAVAFHEAAQPGFRIYQQRILDNAKALAEILVSRGFRLVSGGTDNHLLLVDLRPKGVTGKFAEKVLDRAGLTTNKNTIPFDPESPFVTSGLRLGTPAVTSRGFGLAEMERIGVWIDEVLSNAEDEAVIERVRAEVADMAGSFPVP